MGCIQLRATDDNGPESVTLEGDVIKIGRDVVPRVQLHLDADGVSRMHAVIEIKSDGAYVMDLGSGTKLNGDEIDKGKLFVGARLQFGNATVCVESITLPDVAVKPVVRLPPSPRVTPKAPDAKVHVPPTLRVRTVRLVGGAVRYLRDLAREIDVESRR